MMKCCRYVYTGFHSLTLSGCDQVLGRKLSAVSQMPPDSGIGSSVVEMSHAELAVWLVGYGWHVAPLLATI